MTDQEQQQTHGPAAADPAAEAPDVPPADAPQDDAGDAEAPAPVVEDEPNHKRVVVGDGVPDAQVGQVFAALGELDVADGRADNEGRLRAMKALYAAGMGDPEIAAARRRMAAQDGEQQRDEEPRDRRAPTGPQHTAAPVKSTPAKKTAAAAKSTAAKK